jgi:hypothetical protein
MRTAITRWFARAHAHTRRRRLPWEESSGALNGVRAVAAVPPDARPSVLVLAGCRTGRGRGRVPCGRGGVSCVILSGAENWAEVGVRCYSTAEPRHAVAASKS